jgi:acyl carrier protein
MNKEELFLHIAGIMQNTFAIDSEKISLESRLGEDLDIDSIDAVDLIVQLKPLLGTSLKPEAFKAVRTVQDVVDVVHDMMHSENEIKTGT